MDFEIKPCPEELRAWQVEVDGASVDAGLVVLRQPKIGLEITLGLRPEGYQGPAIREPGGGGAITLPWFRHPETGEIWVGLLGEDRPNMGGSVWCITGGFVEIGEDPSIAAARELREEAGMVGRPKEIKGSLAINNNRALWVADAMNGEGTKAYGLEITIDQVEFSGNGTSAAFRPGVGFGKKPGAIAFFPWKKAVAITADALALAAIARLIAEIG